MRVQKNGDKGTAQEQGKRFECYGFVVGRLDDIIHEDAQTSRSTAPRICLPPDTTAKIVTKAVANYAIAHPEKQEISGYFLVRMAIAETWPCQQP